MNIIEWYIPIDVWNNFTVETREMFDRENKLVPYPISPGEGKTWITTKSFGSFYVCKTDVVGIETLVRAVPGIPRMIQEWREKAAAKFNLVTE